jgi:hypothetical protein
MAVFALALFERVAKVCGDETRAITFYRSITGSEAVRCKNVAMPLRHGREGSV